MKPLIFLLVAICSLRLSATDSIPSGFRQPVDWRIGVNVAPGWVVPTNSFLDGENPDGKDVNKTISADLRAGFSFSAGSREGILFPGLYQGLGLGVNSFVNTDVLGTPVSAYVYQGAPFVRFGSKFSLGYEWQFGAAFGWKSYKSQMPENNAPVSTFVTAHMGVALKFCYDVTDRWHISAGLLGRHYSNGNTSWPNLGVNSIGATLGVVYDITAHKNATAAPSHELKEEADRVRWIYDIMAFGAFRKRETYIDGAHTLLPGRYAVAGLQFAPLCRFNRWLGAGPALDLMWDESGSIADYRIDGTDGEDIRFGRRPFFRQVSVGLSAHAELTTPIFAINCGIGYDVIKPRHDRRFYQSLTIKAFVTRQLYLNVGYRLARFRDPQNLTLGIGFRID